VTEPVQPQLVDGGEQRLDVVVITRNQRWNVARLIESVRAATVSVGLDVEIVVVDSGSEDGTPGLASDLGVRVIRLAGRNGEAVGRAPANFAGVAQRVGITGRVLWADR